MEPTPPSHSNREDFSRKSHSKSLLPAVGGVVVIVAIIAGYLVYAERAKRVEFERRIAREREKQVEQDRRAQEQAAREAALRRAEEKRRATERATQTKAAREQAARQWPAGETERTKPGGSHTHGSNAYLNRHGTALLRCIRPSLLHSVSGIPFGTGRADSGSCFDISGILETSKCPVELISTF